MTGKQLQRAIDKLDTSVRLRRLIKEDQERHGYSTDILHEVLNEEYGVTSNDNVINVDSQESPVVGIIVVRKPQRKRIIEPPIGGDSEYWRKWAQLAESL